MRMILLRRPGGMAPQAGASPIVIVVAIRLHGFGPALSLYPLPDRRGSGEYRGTPRPAQPRDPAACSAIRRHNSKGIFAAIARSTRLPGRGAPATSVVKRIRPPVGRSDRSNSQMRATAPIEID